MRSFAIAAIDWTVAPHTVNLVVSMKWRADNFDLQIPPWARRLGGWMRDVVDFCYPGLCPACREACLPGSPLCPTCTKNLNTLASSPACFSCGRSVAYSQAPCAHCQGKGIAHYDRVIRLAQFESPLRELVHQLKYHRMWIVGELFADRLLAEDHVQSLLLEADCLVPVPLHGMRQLSRGFNQAAVIAERISKSSNVPVVTPVARIRDTDTQTHLPSRARRMANLRNAFRLTDPSAIEGRRVVVVDDVMTSGATLHTVARTILPSGPRSLSALIVGRAEERVTAKA